MMLKSVKTKIIASQLLLIFSAVLLLGFSSYFLIFSHLTGIYRQNLQDLAYIKAEEVGIFIDNKKDVLDRISIGREFEDYHINYREPALAAYFTRFQGEFPKISWVGKDGQEQLKLIKGVISDKLLNISQSRSFQDALANPNKVMISQTRDDPDLGLPVINFVMARYGYFGEEFIGTLVGTLPLANIIQDLSKDKIGRTGFTILVDRQGRVLSHPQKDKILTKIIMTGREAGKARNSFVDIRGFKIGFTRAAIFGLDSMVAYTQLKETGWSLLVILPYQEFMEVPNNLKKITAGILIGLLILSAILSLVLSNGITRPISKLVEAMNLTSKGDLTKRAQVLSGDEIGQLANMFNDMVENLQETLVSRDELIGEISDRRKAQEALQQNEIYLKTIFNSVQAGVMIIDPETYRIVDVNPVAAHLFGAPPEAIIGRPCHHFICPAEEGKCPIIDLHQQVDNSERVLVKADGTKLPVLKTVVPVLLKNRKLLLETFVDISVRKKADEERDNFIKELQAQQELLQKQKEKLEDSRRAIKNVAEDFRASKDILEYQNKSLEEVNKELDDFTYIVSHDLKEPLRSIDAYSKFIIEDYQDKVGGEAKHYLERIRINADRMKKLIEDLLEISRLKSRGSIIEEVETEELLREMKMRLEYAIKQKSAEIVIKGHFPRIFCDRVRLGEVFFNLISNALKFNDKPKPVIEIGYNDKGNFHEFYVKDNGIGIKEEYFGKIFEIFQRLGKREDAEGTGAGLTIVKKIIHLHKGEIRIESKLGEGSVFYFTIPKEKSRVLGKKLIGEILLEQKLLREEDIRKSAQD